MKTLEQAVNVTKPVVLQDVLAKLEAEEISEENEKDAIEAGCFQIAVSVAYNGEIIVFLNVGSIIDEPSSLDDSEQDYQAELEDEIDDIDQEDDTDITTLIRLVQEGETTPVKNLFDEVVQQMRKNTAELSELVEPGIHVFY